MKNYRECIIEGCTHYVPPQNEVDVGVGVVYSNETPICDSCYLSEDPEIKEQIKKAEEIDDDLPF